MVNTNKKQQQTTAQQTKSVQTLFLDFVKKQGYTTKSYNQLAEQSVQLNGKIKLYFVAMRNGNLKLCLQNIKIPEINGLQGIEVLNQNTYPAKYNQRIYFRNCNSEQVTDFLFNVLQQVLPAVKS